MSVMATTLYLVPMRTHSSPGGYTAVTCTLPHCVIIVSCGWRTHYMKAIWLPFRSTGEEERYAVSGLLYVGIILKWCWLWSFNSWYWQYQCIKFSVFLAVVSIFTWTLCDCMLLLQKIKKFLVQESMYIIGSWLIKYKTVSHRSLHTRFTIKYKKIDLITW